MKDKLEQFSISSRFSLFGFPLATIHLLALTAISTLLPLEFQSLYSDDLVQLVDGSSLQGEFIQLNDSNIRFKHDFILDDINLKSDRVEWLRFDHLKEEEPASEPSAYFSFANGDHVYGQLMKMDDQLVVIRAVTGDILTAQRKFLKSVTHLPDGYRLLYEGPMGNDAWRMTRRTSNFSSSSLRQKQPGWHFRNGIFVAEGPGLLGRSFPLKDTVYIEFDLSWIGFFSLYLGLFSDSADKYDYRSQSYRLTLSPASAAVQKIQPNMRLFEFGRIRFPDMQESSKVSLALLVNRVENTVTLFKDGKVVKEFKEKQNSIPSGNSIVFSSNSTGPYLKLTRLHISTWSGNQPFFSPTSENIDSDILFLKNSDLVEGKIDSVSQKSVSVTTPFFAADIPSKRVIHYAFADVADGADIAESPSFIRASLFGGGKLTLDLNSWDQGKVVGASPVFGDLSFKSELVRQIVFSLENKSDQFDFGDGFQEVIWDDPEED